MSEPDSVQLMRKEALRWELADMCDGKSVPRCPPISQETAALLMLVGEIRLLRSELRQLANSSTGSLLA